MTDMRVQIEHGTHIVSFTAETDLDATTVENVRPQLFALIAGGDAKRILLDLGNIGLVSSHALGMLLTLRMKAQRANVPLALCNASGTLANVMRLTNLDKLYELHPDRAAAMAALSAASS